MHLQAWYNWMAMMNRPIFGYEYKFESFDEKFGKIDPEPSPKFDPDKITTACEKHGLKPPIF